MEPPQSWAYIYDLDVDGYNIPFIWSTWDEPERGFINLGDEEMATLTHRRTIAFDVAGSYTALVVFEDAYGKLRLRVGSPGHRFGGENPFPGTAEDYDFKDLQIYYNPIPSPHSRKALLLDAKRARVALIEYNFFFFAAGPLFIESPYVKIAGWIQLGQGKNPQSFVLNAYKSKAYILNQGDNTVSVLNLVTPAPQLESEINLANAIPSKELSIKPTKIILSPDEENLIITTEDLRSTIIASIDMALPIESALSRAVSLDPDYDRFFNNVDNCPHWWNPTQADIDEDGIGDECDEDLDGDGIHNHSDNCSFLFNPAQENDDDDVFGNVCELDSDRDGVINDYDNCVQYYNPDQVDMDGDGRGDICDWDRDGDTVGNYRDNCPNISNHDQADSDDDGVGDACDDPEDNDFDDDGVQVTEDCNDHNAEIYPGAEDTADNGIDNNCDGIPGVDSDSDRYASIESGGNDCDDENRYIYPEAPDTEDNGIDNNCDGVPGIDGFTSQEIESEPVEVIPGEVEEDLDFDGVLNHDDNCPYWWNPSQSDIDSDAIGDNCDDDRDGDGVNNLCDNCPSTFNPYQLDNDNDWTTGNACESDRDGDGIIDDYDNCVYHPNPNQSDIDGDNIGDICEIDSDGDSIINDYDNCTYHKNRNQSDIDGDGIGDVCDFDRDGDGVRDVPWYEILDNCPTIPNPDQEDIDGDGIGDACDEVDDSESDDSDPPLRITIPPIYIDLTPIW